MTEKNETPECRELCDELHPVQVEIYKNMSYENKFKIICNIYWTARRMKAAAFRSFHPEWSEEKVQDEVRKVFLYAGD